MKSYNNYIPDPINTYYGLEPGDIVKTDSGFFWVVIAVKGYLPHGKNIPLKRIKNDSKIKFTKIKGGKYGFTVFSADKNIESMGFTEYFDKEKLQTEEAYQNLH